MHILLDPAVYDMRNKGNVALLQVAMARLARMWPDARISVITNAPYLTNLYCPGAFPVSPDGRCYETLALPSTVLRLALEVRETIRHTFPHTGGILTTRRIGALLRRSAGPSLIGLANSGREKNSGWRAPNDLDLFVATGAQYMSDACKDDALRVLQRLAAALHSGIRTAMVGQGLGPIHDCELRAHARAVLPSVDLILVRDRNVGPELLMSLGVDPSRVVFTGDDAIELAHASRPAVPGRRIGVGLRRAHYTAINELHVCLIQDVLRQAASTYKTKLEPLAISSSLHERDHCVLRTITGRRLLVSDWMRRLEAPVSVVRRVARCRVVVTGSFHPAVFALAQGIPAIGLAYSPMYDSKFLELAEQFGPGCRVIRLDDPLAREELIEAIDNAWRMADLLRPELLTRAVRYVDLGRDAYRRLYELVTSTRRGLHTPGRCDAK